MFWFLVKSVMENPKKKLLQKSLLKKNFEEIDHRLACGWHVEIEDCGNKKKYLKKREELIN